MVGFAGLLEWFHNQQPMMTWSLFLVGSVVLGFLVAGIGLFASGTHLLTATTHRQQYAFPALLLTLAVSIGTVWLTVATQQSSQHRAAVEATAEAAEWARSQGETYPLRVDTDAGELFSYSGF